MNRDTAVDGWSELISWCRGRLLHLLLWPSNQHMGVCNFSLGKYLNVRISLVPGIKPIGILTRSRRRRNSSICGDPPIQLPEKTGHSVRCGSSGLTHKSETRTLSVCGTMSGKIRWVLSSFCCGGFYTELGQSLFLFALFPTSRPGDLD